MRETTMSTLDQVNAFLGTTKDAREYKRAMAVKMLLLEFEPHVMHYETFNFKSPAE